MTPGGPITRLRRLRADRRGVSTVEFAIAGPAVAVLATLALSGLFLHAGAVSLEMGAAVAARAVAVGAPPGGETRIDVVRRIVTDHVCPPGGRYCHWAPEWQAESDDGVVGPLRITARAYADPRNLGRPEPFADANLNGRFDAGETFVDVNGNGVWDADMGVASLGGSGDYVAFDITMAQTVTHPLLQPVLGQRLMRSARLVVRNEPF